MSPSVLNSDDLESPSTVVPSDGRLGGLRMLNLAVLTKLRARAAHSATNETETSASVANSRRAKCPTQMLSRAMSARVLGCSGNFRTLIKRLMNALRGPKKVRLEKSVVRLESWLSWDEILRNRCARFELNVLSGQNRLPTCLSNDFNRDGRLRNSRRLMPQSGHFL